MKIWAEEYDPVRHLNPMAGEVPASDEISRHWRARTLEPHRVVFVRVVGFTFELHSIAQAEACLAYYSRKHHPSSRLPVETGDYGGDQSETQRWFERLPLFLREEPKRQKVVKALEAAVARFAADAG